ncbi:MAG: hypothetical protein V1721_10390 [Pseudomonadota bacterium]
MPKPEKKKPFPSPGSRNALSGQFDANNGDFDTLEELIRAYINHDTRALEVLDLKNMEQLRDVLERLDPKIREIMIEETSTPQRLQQYLANLADKSNPDPVP